MISSHDIPDVRQIAAFAIEGMANMDPIKRADLQDVLSAMICSALPNEAAELRKAAAALRDAEAKQLLLQNLFANRSQNETHATP